MDLLRLWAFICIGLIGLMMASVLYERTARIENLLGIRFSSTMPEFPIRKAKWVLIRE